MLFNDLLEEMKVATDRTKLNELYISLKFELMKIYNERNEYLKLLTNKNMEKISHE